MISKQRSYGWGISLGLLCSALVGGGCGGSAASGPAEPVVAEACIPGQVQDATTEGHCCWPNQVWKVDRCEGTPTCPAGLVPDAIGGCGCDGGRVVSLATAGHCCFAGQTWSAETNACAGTPTSCPEGTVLDGGTCSLGGWVHIDGATFTMGTDRGAPEEGPPHQVTLSPYDIWRTEVTVAQFRACVAAGACAEPPTTVEWRGITAQKRETYSALCNANREGRESHPMNCIDWQLAQTYCQWQGGRLPTEAEWEYAARGNDGRPYPWGEEPPTLDRMNGCDEGCRQLAAQLGREWDALFEGNDGFPDTAPVGSYPRGVGPFGLLDMSGNVWEWVQDRRGRYNARPATDPTGPASGRERVTRGGAWDDDLPELVKTTSRDVAREDLRDVNVGFRCVRPANAPASAAPGSDAPAAAAPAAAAPATAPAPAR